MYALHEGLVRYVCLENVMEDKCVLNMDFVSLGMFEFSVGS